MDTKALRQKILDLAIRGKLVPQDPNDEPAAVLLERIRAEKQQMVKDGKLKAKDIKGDTVIFKGEDNLHYEKFADGTVKCIEDEIPFEVPEGWAWARLKHICMMSAGKAKPSDQINPEPFEGCYPCFGGNGIRGYVDDYNQNGTFSIVVGSDVQRTWLPTCALPPGAIRRDQERCGRVRGPTHAAKHTPATACYSPRNSAVCRLRP